METKIKVSLTLAPDVLHAVDRQAALPGHSRSEVVEAWLRRAMKMTAEEKLRADTIAYYESLTIEERAEEEAMVRGFTRASRKHRLDE